MSTGAAAGVIAQWRRAQRREEARRQRKRAIRQARWESIRVMREHEGDIERSASRWPFACASVCGQCGALAVPSTQTSGDPMRRGLASNAPNRCPHCDAEGPTMIDLANREMATALVDSETHDRDTHAKRHRIVGGPLVQTIVLAALATAAFVVGGAPVVGGTLAAASLQRGVATAQHLAAQGKDPTHARRWTHHPEPEAPVTRTKGDVTGALRHAPLSGQPCVAYDVRVVWNGESPWDMRSLALHEQATDTLHVGRDDASRAYLDVEPKKLSFEQVLKSPQALEFLASRGLEPSDGPFDYYERVILARESAELSQDAQGRLAVRV